MEHFKDNSGCSGPKKSEIFWNNSRKVQYVFAGVEIFASFKYFLLQCFQNKDINKVTILKELVRSLFYVDLHIAVFSICFHYYLK